MIKKNQKYQQSKNTIKKHTSIISEKKKSSILFIIIVFSIPVLLYLQTINFRFTCLDDYEMITENITFLSDFSNTKQVFLTDAYCGKTLSFYRPLQTLSYMVDIKLSGGNNPWMYHLSNILLLGLISCSFFLLLKRFSVPAKLALSGTLIYCIHPLFVSAITWIPGRGDLLLTFFSLLSFLFFIELIQKRNIIFLFLNWTTFTVALFCKETAVLLPFLFIIYYFTFSLERHFEKKYIFYILLYVVSGLFWFWLRFKAIGGISNRYDTVGLTTLLLNLRTIPESLVKLFAPYDNNPMPVFSIFKTLAGLGIIAIIIILFFRNRDKSKKEKIFFFTWFLILMLPPMLYKHIFIDYYDHRFFLPLIGILFFLLLTYPKKWLRNGDIKISMLMIAVFIFLCSLTFIKCRSYSNQWTFYNSAISENPNFAFAYNNRGFEKFKTGDIQGAIEDYSKAIDISPTYNVAFCNRGFAKSKMGDDLGAIKDYFKAISTRPDFDRAYYCIGVSKAKLGDYPGAIENYNKAINISPRYSLAYCDRGVSKVLMGDNPGAIEDFNKAIEIYPKYDQAYCNRGFVKAKMGNNQEAIEDFNKAIDIYPMYVEAYHNRGISKAKLGDNHGAIEDYNKAIDINPAFGQALISRGYSKVILGDNQGAIEDYNKAIAINSIYTQAFANRAFAKYNLKDLNGAIEDCEKVLSLNPNNKEIFDFKNKLQKELQKRK